MFDFKEIEQAELQKQPKSIEVAPATSAPIVPYRPVETVQGELIDPPSTTSRPKLGGVTSSGQVFDSNGNGRSGTAVSGGGSFDRRPAPPPAATPGGRSGIGSAVVGGAVTGSLTSGLGGALTGAGATIGGGTRC